MKIFHAPSLLAVLTLIATARVSPAQQADSARDSTEVVRVAPVVVTATRTPIARERVPASVTVLDGAALRAQGVMLVSDALREVPGVAVVRAGSYGAQTSLFVRGGQSNYTKVLVDGIPYNDPGGALDLANLTIDDIDRIEIVRGPSSVVFGSDAVTGVVQIVTRRRGATSRASLDARGGTYGTVDVALTGAAPAGSLAVDAGLAHHATNGIYNLNSSTRNDVANAAVTVTPWGVASLRATARFSDVRSHYPTDFTGAPVDPNAYRTERRTLLGAELAQPIGAATVTLAVTSNLADAATIDPPNVAGDDEHDTRSHTVRQAADLRFRVPIAVIGNATVGGALERQHLVSPNATRRDAAAYAELVHDDAVTTMTAGARLDHSESYGEFGTFRVAASRRVGRGMRLRASVGTAFREPSFVEAYATAFSVANADLRPERTASWEAGVERTFGRGAVTAGATYFTQRFTDLVDYRFDPSGSRFENIARARSRGAEAELRIAPWRRVALDASYTYLDTRVLTAGFDPSPDATIREGGPLLRRPKHGASLGFSARVAEASVDARATYVGRREDRLFHGAPTFATETVQLAPYATIDLATAIPLTPHAALTLRLDNALAARYESIAGYATPGRVILIGVRID